MDDTLHRQPDHYPMTIQPETRFSTNPASYSYCRNWNRIRVPIVAVESSNGTVACDQTGCHVRIGSDLDGSGPVSIHTSVLEHTMTATMTPDTNRINRVHIDASATRIGPQRLFRVGIVKGEYPDQRTDSLWIYTSGGMLTAHDVACTRYPVASDGWRITHMQKCQRIGIPPTR